MHTAILSVIPESDPDVTKYLIKLLGTSKPEQQNNVFWFPTPENPGKTEDNTTIQTRFLRELRELQGQEKLYPKDDVESRMKFPVRFDWTDTPLMETEKHAVEDCILVEYHDIFAGHRTDIEMSTEFRMRLTPKDDKAV